MRCAPLLVALVLLAGCCEEDEQDPPDDPSVLVEIQANFADPFEISYRGAYLSSEWWWCDGYYRVETEPHCESVTAFHEIERLVYETDHEAARITVVYAGVSRTYGVDHGKVLVRWEDFTPSGAG